MKTRGVDFGRGEVIVFTGSGVGKTTAALGVALRIIAYGGKVIFVYFTGPQYPVLGEVKTAAAFSNNWRMIGIRSEAKDPAYLIHFSYSVNTPRDALAMSHNQWLNECDLLVLDDISSKLEQGTIDIDQVLSLLDSRPLNLSIILTGTSFPKPIIERADLVTEFSKIKKP